MTTVLTDSRAWAGGLLDCRSRATYALERLPMSLLLLSRDNRVSDRIIVRASDAERHESFSGIRRPLCHANHYVFLSNEADVLREMDAFIGGLK